MRTLRTLKPGQRGTKEPLRRHGASLLLVRYRYDEETREHLPPSGGEILALGSSFRRRELPCGSRVQRAARQKTVELVVQRRLREEAGSAGARKVGGQAAVAVRRRVALRIGWRERELQGRVKSAGARWDPVRRVWVLRRDVAERLELLDRVVGGGGGV